MSVSLTNMAVLASYNLTCQKVHDFFYTCQKIFVYRCLYAHCVWLLCEGSIFLGHRNYGYTELLSCYFRQLFPIHLFLTSTRALKIETER